MKWVFPDEELPAMNKRILVATKGGRVVACGARLMNGWVIDEEYKKPVGQGNLRLGTDCERTKAGKETAVAA